jgi:hypothetical protein
MSTAALHSVNSEKRIISKIIRLRFRMTLPFCHCEEMQFLAYASEQALQYSEIAAHLSGAGNDKKVNCSQ